MNLINVETEQVLSDRAFRKLLCNVSFPDPITLDAVQPYGYSIVKQAEIPELGLGQECNMGAPVANDDGYWYETYTITDDAAKAIAIKSAKVRQERDQLLADTDWSQLNDVVSPPGYVEYRQALRDITSQPGFPDNVLWPTLP